MDQKAVVVKSKNTFLKLIPKAASVVNFQNSLNSPNKDKRCDNAVTKFKSNLGKGYSSRGSVFSVIPPEARQNSKNSNSSAAEPTSPKISCMGTIKHNRKLFTKKSLISIPPESNGLKPAKKKTRPPPIQKAMSFSEGKVKKQSAFRSIFGGGGGKHAGRNSDASADDSKPPLPDRAPTLSQMRMFASGRDTFVNFDWTNQIAVVDSEQCKYYLDDERDNSEEEEEDLSGCRRRIQTEAKKEINLWKRRSMAKPKPLQLL